MSKKLFTATEIEILSKNKYVKNVSEKGITYSDEFKEIFIEENKNGKFPREIFEDHGFDVEVLGIRRIKASGNRWRKNYESRGILGIKDTRKNNSGRTKTKGLTLEEKNQRLEAQVNLLKAENEFLKKLDMLERKAIRKRK